MLVVSPAVVPVSVLVAGYSRLLLDLPEAWPVVLVVHCLSYEISPLIRHQVAKYDYEFRIAAARSFRLAMYLSFSSGARESTWRQPTWKTPAPRASSTEG